MKVFGQLEKSQLENLTVDPSGAGLVPGLIWYRTDTKVFKVYDGTVVQTFVDLTSAQTLSNKTLTAPVITGGTATNTSLIAPTINVETHVEQTVAPSTPTTGQRKLYPKADGFYQLTSGGLESKIGSGGGGSVNFITNGNADDAVTSILIPYIGSGVTPAGPGTGSPGDITTSITTTTPLNGTKSYLFNKAGSVNSQGRGAKIPFTVDLAYRAKSIKISFDYLVNSGVFTAGSSTANSDVIIYIWDLTNNVAIEPSNIKLLSNSTTITDRYEASFQTSSNGSNYLLMFHVATALGTAFELEIDNISVGPQNYVYGSPTTNNRSYPATLTNFGTATQNLYYKDDGDEIVISGFIAIGATAPSSTLLISLPPGMVYDPTKVGLNGAVNLVGSATAYRNSTGGTFQGSVFLGAGSNTLLQINGENNGTAWNATNPMTFSQAAQDRIYLNNVRVPILGKSSSAQMSDGFDGRELTLRMVKTSAQTLTASILTKITFDTTSLSKGLIWDSANSRVVCVSAGTYSGSASLLFGTGGTGESVVTVFKNASTSVASDARLNTGGSPTPKTPFTIDLIVGDFLEVFGQHSSGGALNVVGNSGISFFSVSKVLAPTTISASEKIRMSYGATSGQSIPSGGTGTVLTHNVREWDTHGVYNPATGEITFPRAGFGKLTIYALSSGTGNVSTMIYNVYKDNVEIRQIGRLEINTSSARNYAPPAQSITIEGVAGTKYKVAFFQNTGVTLTILASTIYNFIQFEME